MDAYWLSVLTGLSALSVLIRILHERKRTALGDAPSMTALKREVFRLALEQALCAGTVENLEDILVLYKQNWNLSSPSSAPGLADALEVFVADLISGALGSKLHTESRLHWKRTLLSHVGTLRASAPYEDLPPLESKFLNDLHDSLSRGEATAARNRLPEVADLLKDQMREIRDLRSLGRRNSGWTVVGLVATVIFGLASMCLALISLLGP